jgi:hypothetical protein
MEVSIFTKFKYKECGKIVFCASECKCFETDVRRSRTFSDEISNTIRESV